MKFKLRQRREGSSKEYENPIPKGGHGGLSKVRGFIRASCPLFYCLSLFTASDWSKSAKCGYERRDLLWPHWLIDSCVPFSSSLKKSSNPRVYSRQRKSGSVQRICHLPPWPPGAMVISIQVNITGCRFPIMIPHSASRCLGSQP